MASHLVPVTRATIRDAPSPCVECVFWQTRGFRPPTKERWAARAEEDWGVWGTMYAGDDRRALGFLQFGPSDHFPRSFQLPAGPPSPDAVLITCAYLVDPSTPWVMKSLFLAAIGAARERDVRAVEAFGYRYPDGLSATERFHTHRTIFPADFLADFGFQPVRSAGRVELARLRLGGIIPAEDGEGLAARVRRAVTGLLQPLPAPQRP